MLCALVLRNSTPNLTCEQEDSRGVMVASVAINHFKPYQSLHDLHYGRQLVVCCFTASIVVRATCAPQCVAYSSCVMLVLLHTTCRWCLRPPLL